MLRGLTRHPTAIGCSIGRLTLAVTSLERRSFGAVGAVPAVPVAVVAFVGRANTQHFCHSVPCICRVSGLCRVVCIYSFAQSTYCVSCCLLSCVCCSVTVTVPPRWPKYFCVSSLETRTAAPSTGITRRRWLDLHTCIAQGTMTDNIQPVISVLSQK